MATTPVYLFAGFLESGKTTFIESVLQDPNFTRRERTLLIMTEEGEVEIDPMVIKKSRTIVESFEDQEELTTEVLYNLIKKHKPDRIIIELNGMWDLEQFVVDISPVADVYEIVTTVNGETFEMYINNMGAKMIEHIAAADMVVFNRCDEIRKAQVRARNIKAMNPRASIYFESPEGVGESYDEGLPPPFDLDAPIIEIEDKDYGLFYVDAMNAPERYEGKTVRFKGQVYRDRNLPGNSFVPGRMANVCCADDIRFIGFICMCPAEMMPLADSWITLTAEVRVENMKQYRGEGAVLYAKAVEPATEPEVEVVEFN